MARETALYYAPMGNGDKALVKSALVRLGIRIKNVSPENVGQTVGCLLGRKGFDKRANTEMPVLEKPVLLLDGFNDKRLDILLRELRKAGVSIPYKAVVTETNLGWLFWQLYDELAKEHEAVGK